MNRIFLNALLPVSVGLLSVVMIVVLLLFDRRATEAEVVHGLEASCAEDCFPFVSDLVLEATEERPVTGCWCADLGDSWHPPGW